ncbi:hypothetical protein CMUS01_16026 [Colletotrichum musicola]|uniref:LPXTG-domain-containing protein n=1 Tax=Colletotrichum musicola TaxID=2175873 RepID=A0A8H6IRT4_9PEZI|nr:hypothetical protein CMUS01_16026 [Colletotrichum musicola]
MTTGVYTMAGTTDKPIEEYPPYPSTWNITAGCVATPQYYRVIVASDSTTNMWGTPTPYTTGNGPSGAFFPPNWTVGGGYRTEGDCPWGYRRACASGRYKSGQPPTSYITCCPHVGLSSLPAIFAGSAAAIGAELRSSVSRSEHVTGLGAGLDIQRRQAPPPLDNINPSSLQTATAFQSYLFECTEDVYGCVVTFSTYHQLSDVLANIWIPTPTEVPTIRSSVGGESMAAWGIKLVWTEPINTEGTTIATGLPGATTTRPSDSSSPTSATEEDNSSAALSTGALAGIAIGTGALVALIALVAFLIYRHRRKRETKHQQYYNALPPGEETGEFASPGPMKGPPVHEAPDTGPNNRNTEAWELRG